MSDRFQSALGRTAECPDLEALAGEPRTPEIERHIAACGYCRAELALLHEFESAEPGPEELASVQWIESELRRRSAADGPSPTLWERLSGWVSPGGQRAWVMVAASLMVLVAAGLIFRPNGPVGVPSAPHGTVWRSGKFAAVGPVGEIAASPNEFRWEGVTGAAGYRVQLMEVDRTVIWTGESTGTSITIPDTVRGQLKPGRSFQWQAVAQNAAGEQLAATDLQSFHIPVTRP
ncbi:MAG: hypothetical protein JWP63_104 [Candidatus Solibacter sp.]|nr:hypothetical protein [Candidatus Solibacter sp.]